MNAPSLSVSLPVEIPFEVSELLATILVESVRLYIYKFFLVERRKVENCDERKKSVFPCFTFLPLSESPFPDPVFQSQLLRIPIITEPPYLTLFEECFFFYSRV